VEDGAGQARVRCLRRGCPAGTTIAAAGKGLPPPAGGSSWPMREAATRVQGREGNSLGSEGEACVGEGKEPGDLRSGGGETPLT